MGVFLKNVQLQYYTVMYIVRKKMALVQRKVTVILKKNGRRVRTSKHNFLKSNILKMWAPLKHPALFGLTSSPLEMLGRFFFF